MVLSITCGSLEWWPPSILFKLWWWLVRWENCDTSGIVKGSQFIMIDLARRGPRPCLLRPGQHLRPSLQSRTQHVAILDHTFRSRQVAFRVRDEGHFTHSILFCLDCSLDRFYSSIFVIGFQRRPYKIILIGCRDKSCTGSSTRCNFRMACCTVCAIPLVLDVEF